jgi:hypothetical protein
MTEPAEARPAPRARPGARRPQLRVGAVLALALLIGFVVWLAVGRGGGSSKTPSGSVPAATKSVPISIGGLRTLGSALNRPIYWAGARPGLQYELSQAPDGRVWIRYLPKNEAIGEQARPYLTVGTYPVGDGYAATATAARQSGTVRIAAGRGAIAFYTTSHPTNVYVGYRGSKYQIEVFDPSATAAHELVASGKIRTIPGNASAAGPVSTTPQKLKALSTSLGQPIYWVGAQSGVTYELTRSADGRVYVRYLPAGVKVGERATPYLTVATYPLADAFAATERASQASGAVTIPAKGGAIAFYDRSSPTSVHLAYPGAKFQVELLDPSAARAHQLAASGSVRPVR